MRHFYRTLVSAKYPLKSYPHPHMWGYKVVLLGIG